MQLHKRVRCVNYGIHQLLVYVGQNYLWMSIDMSKTYLFRQDYN